ncbi:hypothetical protein ACX80V_13620 [Arthrobacter sp. MDT3-24]
MTVDVLETLVRREDSVSAGQWAAFWAAVVPGQGNRAEAVGVLSSLATDLPDTATMLAFIASLQPEGHVFPETLGNTVNIVGTGGGPQTMNISTAAALVAAAAGARVVKTGSRSYSSSLGSIDLLGRAGISTSANADQTLDQLRQFRLAFAGQYVYPVELARLARTIIPVGMKTFGRFLNVVGPFIATVPAEAQLTGVSARAPLAMVREIAQAHTARAVWVTSNDHGVDELLSFSVNTIYRPDGTVECLEPGSVTSGKGELADLAPVGADDAVGHFLEAVGGGLNRTVTETIGLNAACLLLAAGEATTWHAAYDAAMDSMRGGSAVALAARVASAGPVSIPAPAPALAAPAGRP